MHYNVLLQKNVPENRLINVSISDFSKCYKIFFFIYEHNSIYGPNKTGSVLISMVKNKMVDKIYA
jgi:hypothetical protein